MAARLLLFATAVATAMPAHGEPSARQRTATAVFEDLVAAVGDGRTPPSLRVVATGAGGDLRVLWYDADRHAVAVEEQAYDLLTGGRPDSLDALAFVLGHELAHYYKDHDWIGDFSRQVRDLGIGRTLHGLGASRYRRVEVESEADYFGGFFGHMAGYDALAAAPDALVRLYEGYGLADSLRGYPPLDERQSLLSRSAQRLQGMVPVFDAGTNLLLLGQYEEAARCFDFIARDFPSREILNNAGVARALEAIGLFAAGELPYVYPLEIDAATRLAGGRKADAYRIDDANRERRTRFLAQAERALQAACAKDPAYATARVNLACVADLLGRHEEAELHAGRALDLARSSGQDVSAAHALIVRGIVRARREPPDAAGAAADFEAAVTGSRALALLDLQVLRSGRWSAAEAVGPPTAGVAGRTDAALALDYDDTIDSPDATCVVPAADEDETQLVLYSKVRGRQRSLVIDTGYRTVAFSTIADGAPGTARGLHAGDDLTRLTRLYGPPDRCVATRQGSYHVYGGDGILILTRADTVRSWTAFALQ